MATRLNGKAAAWLVGLSWLGLLAAGGRVAAEETPARPNIVMILADDLGFGDLSSYGAKDLRTPHLDKLVASGLRFENFYANCTVCSPTRAALLTGRYQELVGVPGVIRTHAENSWGSLAPSAVMLPQLLRQAGYHTALVGKWHLGLESPDLPNERGFDLFHGYAGDMMDDYYTHRRHNINYMRKNDKEIDPTGHATDLFSQWASGYLRDRATAKQPFFLYLAYNAPHTPLQPPEDWLSKVKAREPNMKPDRARLVALIEHLDAGIGQVLQTLEETKLAENTLVVFSSDNGGQLPFGFNGPWRGGKGDSYEGGLRVPTCAVWPGKITPESRTAQAALTMDLFPTFCDAAGVSAPAAIEGRSLLPTLLGKTQPPLREEWFWTRREGGNYVGLSSWAARKGDWKLVQNLPTEPFELYNLAEDPQEQHDLARREPKKLQELQAALKRQIQRGGAVPWQRP